MFWRLNMSKVNTKKIGFLKIVYLESALILLRKSNRRECKYQRVTWKYIFVALYLLLKANKVNVYLCFFTNWSVENFKFEKRNTKYLHKNFKILLSWCERTNLKEFFLQNNSFESKKKFLFNFSFSTASIFLKFALHILFFSLFHSFPLHRIDWHLMHPFN